MQNTCFLRLYIQKHQAHRSALLFVFDFLDVWEHSAYLVEVCPKVRIITGSFFATDFSTVVSKCVGTQNIWPGFYFSSTCSETPQSDYVAIVRIVKSILCTKVCEFCSLHDNTSLFSSPQVSNCEE